MKRKTALVAAILFLFSYIVMFVMMLLEKRLTAIDYVLVIGMIVIIYVISLRYDLPSYATVLGMFFTLPHAIGIQGLYAEIIYYDFFAHSLAMALITVFIIEVAYAMTDFRKRVGMFVLIVLAALGLGAIHEIIEYLGYILLGVGDSLLQLGTGDFSTNIGVWENTIIDMIFNGAGIIISTTLWFLFRRVKKQ
jgi:hypothetical protein